MIRHFIAMTAIAAVPFTAAVAQTTTPNTTPPAATTSPGATTTTPGSTVTPNRDPAARATTTTGTMSTGAVTYVDQQSADQMMASRLIGMTVRGSGDENIGEINDLVVDRSGNIEAVVIGVGGFLGIGEKDVAVPFENVTMQADGQNRNSMRAMVASTKDALKNAPEFRRVDDRTAAGTTAPTGATGAGTPATGMGTTGTGTGTTVPRTTTPQ